MRLNAATARGKVDTMPHPQNSATPPPRESSRPLPATGGECALELDALPSPVWRAGTDGRRDWFNRAWLAFTGRRADQETGDGWWAGIHPDDAARCREAYLAAVEARQPFQLEYRLRHRDGSFHWIRDRGQPLIGPQGQSLGYIGTCEDIEVHRRKEQALLESEAQFRGVVEQHIAGIYIIVDGKFVYVNPAFTEVIGFPKEDFLGRDYIEFVIEEDRPLVAENIQRRLAGEVKSVRYSFRARRRDGALVHVGVHGGMAIYQGRPAIIGVAQDITELKKAEERISQDAARLERAMLSTIETLSLMSELRDPYTAGHERQVGDLAAAIGREMGLPEETLKGLRVMGYLHDIGKITVPAEILSKPGHLSRAEFELIKAHPQAGYDILKSVEFPWPVVDAILQHHEHLDGSGYPNGLKGEAIGLEARIIAVADIVDAMAHHRPYRPVVGLENAFEEIRSGAGIRYDEVVVQACLLLFREKRFHW
jgi:PAS domain S-box-containing protein/putative nucleotidyltransferase with HDIG domain